MLGYKIKINNIPEYVWACETTVNDYMWINRNQKDMLEISFSKYSSKKIITNGQNFLLKKWLVLLQNIMMLVIYKINNTKRKSIIVVNKNVMILY